MSEQSKKPDVSVAICTHNPREDYLRRTLEALRKQTLPKERWELLLIDNASSEQLAAKWDLSGHPSARVIREEEVGLTAARLRAMREAKADLLLFLDDDNEVFTDYLEQGLRISADWPILGVWGGQWFAEYEHGMPKDWTQDVWSTHFKQDLWSNNYDREAAPYGGGMFLRKVVADEYSRGCLNNRVKRQLDRGGGGLGSHGDYDIGFTACDLGMGMGRFVALKLTHLIPAYRTTPEYCARLREDSAFSNVLFRFVRGEKVAEESRADKLFERYREVRMLLSGQDVTLLRADRRGKRRAFALLKRMRVKQ